MIKVPKERNMSKRDLYTDKIQTSLEKLRALDDDEGGMTVGGFSQWTGNDATYPDPKIKIGIQTFRRLFDATLSLL